MKILAGLTVAMLASSAQVDPLAPLPDVPAPGPTVVQYSPPPLASPVQTGFAAYKTRLAGLARAAGVREATIQAVVPFLSVNSRVVELDRSQRPTSTSGSAPSSFGPYINRHITRSLVMRGYERYAGHWTNLTRIRERYGVEP